MRNSEKIPTYRSSRYMYLVRFSRYWRTNQENSLFSSTPHACLTPPIRGTH